MANKGFNTQILEAREEIVNAINDTLKKGIPLSVVSMIIDNVRADINMTMQGTLRKEKELYEEEIAKEKKKENKEEK
jgi:hypothetical protein